MVPVSRSQAALHRHLKNSKFEQKIANVKRQAAQVEAGEKRISRLAEEVERGRTKGGRRNVEASILLGRETGGSETIRPSQEQQDLIKQYAKSEGIWPGDIQEPGPALSNQIWNISNEKISYIPPQPPLLYSSKMLILENDQIFSVVVLQLFYK